MSTPATSFPLFPRLPLELQLLIWTFAASPCGPIILSDLLFRFLVQPNAILDPESVSRNFFSCVSPARLHLVTRQFKDHTLMERKGQRKKQMARQSEWALYEKERPEEWAVVRGMAGARWAVAGTCRAARGVVLRAWRREVEGVLLEVFWRWGGSAGKAARMEESRVVKRKTVELLEGLIRQVE